MRSIGPVVALRQSVEELSRYYAKPKAICLSAAKADWATGVIAKGDFLLVRESAACPKVEVSSQRLHSSSRRRPAEWAPWFFGGATKGASRLHRSRHLGGAS